MKEKDFLKNNRLFSDYYLEELLPKDLIWDIDVSEDFRKIKDIYESKKDVVAILKERPLEDQFIRPILRVLGHIWEVEPSLRSLKKPDYSFYEVEEEKVAAELSEDYFGNAIAIGEVKRWGRSLDRKLKGEANRFEVYTPSLQMEMYLWRTEVKWGILTDGRFWRIYERNTSSKLDIYYEVDLIKILENRDLESFKYFYLFFRKEAFPNFLNKVYEESVDYAKAVSKDLKSNVYKAIRILANGFLKTPGNNLSIDNLQEIHDNSLIFLYRLLFILYAESGELLPLQKSMYRESYSLYTIKKEISEKIDSNESIPILHKGYWSKIKVLFNLINDGSESFGISKDEFIVPSYNGGLFNPGKNIFLEKNQVSDPFIAKVIDLLSRSTIKNEGGKAFVDYSSLDIRHLGSIYEGLLENKLKVAQEDMLAIKKGKKEIWIEPEELGNKKAIDKVSKGELYPVTDKGERKVTGSYYTPDYIVKYMVENTIGPLIEEKKNKVEKEEDLIDEILSLKILDPAMGSGHFLVETTDFIARSLVEALGASPKEIEEEDIRWARREVVEKCIYGVDLNPLAVELAKLSLWLSTVSKDKPLSFLDHHLKCGNSLIGVRIEDLAELPDIKSKKKKKMLGQISTYEILFNKKIEVLLNNRKFIEELPSEKVEQIREKEKYEEEFRKKIERFKQIADLWTSIYFSNEISWENYITVQDKLESSEEEWQKIINEEWFERGLNIYKEKRFFHWELEFPEIFYEGDRKKENPGFDVVIGNPPYVRVHKQEEEEKNYLRDRYISPRGDFDIYICFIELSLIALKKDGYLSFITPDKFLTRDYGMYLRYIILNNTLIEELMDVSRCPDIFEGSTYPLIFRLKVVVQGIITAKEIKNYFDNIVRIIKVEGLGKELVPLIMTINKKYPGITLFKENQKIFSSQADGRIQIPGYQMETETIIKKLDSYKKIGKIKNINIFCGTPRAKDYYKWIKYLSDSKPSKGKFLKYIVCRNITPHNILWGIGVNSLGKRYKHPWFLLKKGAMTQKRMDNFSTKPKVLVRGNDNRLTAAVDEEGFVFVGIYGINQDEFDVYFLSSIINSTLIQWFFKYKNPSIKVSGEYFSVNSPHLKQLPLPMNEDEEYTKIIRFARNISFLKKYLHDELEKISFNNIVKKNITNAISFNKIVQITTSSNAKKLDKKYFTNLESNGEKLVLTVGTKKISLIPKDRELVQFIETFLREMTSEEVDLLNEKHPEYTIKDKLKKLSFPDVSIKTVDKILKEWEEHKIEILKTEDEIERIDRVIDRMVYNLYELTEEEIKIVEKSVWGNEFEEIYDKLPNRNTALSLSDYYRSKIK